MKRPDIASVHLRQCFALRFFLGLKFVFQEQELCFGLKMCVSGSKFALRAQIFVFRAQICVSGSEFVKRPNIASVHLRQCFALKIAPESVFSIQNCTQVSVSHLECT